MAPKKTESIADGLFRLQLQHQVHRLLSKLSQDVIEDVVEEGLGITKSFLELLQTSLGIFGRTIGSSVSATPMDMESNLPDERGPAGTKPMEHDAGIIDILQALTHYSLILHMLEKVVGAVNSISKRSTALSLGSFSLVSQGALNRDVVLHIVFRMIHQLRMLIDILLSNCKDITHGSSTNTGHRLDAASTTGGFQALAELMSEREKTLMERCHRSGWCHEMSRSTCGYTSSC